MQVVDEINTFQLYNDMLFPIQRRLVIANILIMSRSHRHTVGYFGDGPQRF